MILCDREIQLALREGRKEARRIERERLTWALPLAQLTRAGVASVCGDHATAADLLARAVAGFDAAEMGVFAAAARRRLGQASPWLEQQGVRDPERMVTAVVPW